MSVGVAQECRSVEWRTSHTGVEAQGVNVQGADVLGVNVRSVGADA